MAIFNEKKKATNISHAESNIKNHTRLQLALSANLFEDISRPIKLVSLGGVEFGFEKYLDFIGVNYKGISYEKEAKLIQQAQKNRPANVEVRKGNIFDYVYQGDENIIWLDLMHCVTNSSVSDLIKYVDNNKFKHSFTFAFTFAIRTPRNGGELSPSLQQMFGKYKTHGIVDHVSIHIEKHGFAEVTNAKIMPYKNYDVSFNATDMCLYVLDVKKKK